MKNTKNILALLVLLIASAGFSQNRVRSAAYNKMLEELLSHNVNEVSVMQTSSDTAKTFFLDARERKEYNVSHLKNAIWVGYDSFSMDNVKGLDKNSKIVVYCSVGYRSEKITKKLTKKGFTNVQNLYGGIFEWKNQGNDVFTQSLGKTIETDNVHAYDRNWGRWLNSGKKVY